MPLIEFNKQELISLRKLLHCQIEGKLPSVARKVEEALKSQERLEELNSNKTLFN